VLLKGTGQMKKIEFTPEDLNSLKKNKEDALANGEKYFYNGLICKNGHDSPKIVTNGRCFICKRIENRIIAEKRREKNGVLPKIKFQPIQKGEKYGELIATGEFKTELTTNRKKNRNVNYNEVICSCGKKFWMVSYNWGVSEQCPNCWIKIMTQNNIIHNESQTIIGQLFYSAKIRAKKSGIEFNLKIDDIKIPKLCPILDIELNINLGESINRKPRFNAPSLDRINSDLGYVKGNVSIMSYKANVLKKDGTSSEHLEVAEFMEKMGIKS
jgi:hypothetical protein